MDDAVHPFAIQVGAGDVRITTRWDEDFWATGLYGAMHECGHGLYEAGIAPALRRTPLGSAESLGVHESQSRLWENMVGRGRPFCGVLAPRIAELAGGDWPASTPTRCTRGQPGQAHVHPRRGRRGHLRAAHRAALRARAGADRGHADGATICRRRGTRASSEYFGIKVPDDADGVLQDVHWSAGMIGYFPTYALGNLIAGQLWERAHADMPDLDDAAGRRRAVGAARMAAGAHPPPRGEVHDRRAAAAATGGADRGGAVRELPEGQALRRLRH